MFKPSTAFFRLSDFVFNGPQEDCTVVALKFLLSPGLNLPQQIRRKELNGDLSERPNMAIIVNLL